MKAIPQTAPGMFITLLHGDFFKQDLEIFYLPDYSLRQFAEMNIQHQLNIKKYNGEDSEGYSFLKKYKVMEYTEHSHATSDKLMDNLNLILMGLATPLGTGQPLERPPVTPFILINITDEKMYMSLFHKEAYFESGHFKPAILGIKNMLELLHYTNIGVIDNRVEMSVEEDASLHMIGLSASRESEGLKIQHEHWIAAVNYGRQHQHIYRCTVCDNLGESPCSCEYKNLDLIQIDLPEPEIEEDD